MKYNTISTMKNRFLLCAAILSFTACTNDKELSLQERAERFAESVVKQTLYIPDSYEAVVTRVDSAFVSVYNDVRILEAAERIIEIEDDNEFYLLFDSRRGKIEKEVEELVGIIRTRAGELPEKEFCGWNIYHRCRAKNNAGRVGFVEDLLVADKDFESVICAFDLDDMKDVNFKRYQRLIDDIVDSTYYKFGVDSKYSGSNGLPPAPPLHGGSLQNRLRSLRSSYSVSADDIMQEFDDLAQEILSVDEIDLADYDIPEILPDEMPSPAHGVDLPQYGDAESYSGATDLESDILMDLNNF